MGIYEMKNTIKNYAWGSSTFLPELIGHPSPANEPQAELWMGTHPQGISQVKDIHTHGSDWALLDELISKQPEKMLGPRVADTFKNQLPFLFKILAIDQPLSIQVHPDNQRAITGYEYENKIGIDLSAADRNFKDRHHKPELVCALTPLWAMCGFRPFLSIHSNFQFIDDESLFQVQRSLLKDNTTYSFFFNLMHLSKKDTQALVDAAVHYAKNQLHQIHWEWVHRLSQKFQNDVGVLGPLFLNTVCLQPLEALYIRPGMLHAYLYGNAVEIMTNSDNVIRGGLTVKHIDIDTLMDVVSFRSEAIPLISPQTIQPNEMFYQTPADGFMLTRYNIHPEQSFDINVYGPEILLCVKGEVSIDYNGSKFRLTQGQSIFVAHSAGKYTLSGNGEIFKGFVRNEL
ncbi:MAG: mannose-6-phosphate isomerase, class I [Candidatus Magnetomorum sp.]|nr:mannose-6-phosphate isomerase, class I [Candidatus Magnetomorum sp.]